MQEVFPAINGLFNAVIRAATVGQPYLSSTNGYKFGVAGGTPPYSFQESPLVPLPPGMTLSSAGVLAGTPAQPGDFTIRPIVTDHLGQVYIATAVTLSIAPAAGAVPLNLSGDVPLNDASVGSAYLTQLDSYLMDGTAPYTWSVANGSTLPPGISIIAGSSGVGNFLGGVPTTPGQYTFTLRP